MAEADANNLLRSFALGGSLERLSVRILEGKAVFFVGAGFSRAGEGNDGWRLVGRLLARFMAMTEALLKSGDPGGRIRAEEFRGSLLTTFSLNWANHMDLSCKSSIDDISKSITILAGRYYDINDWMCSAFGELATLLKGGRLLQRQMLAVEGKLLACLKIPAKPEKIDPRLLRSDFGHQRGKALFLDAMGFQDPEVMAGDPFNTHFEEIEKSYKGRLRAGHFILGRLAREGLCPTLLTTNYDLLLEGACRLVGFSSKEDLLGCPVPTSYPELTRISGSGEFFAKGDGYRSALLIKIHGCVEKYREARNEVDSWKAYLPAMVFTYREIQNWRRDSWSRDLVRTLLRTRTIVFCGYSGADPVLHDTFRSVYEEMAEQQERARPLKATRKSSDKPVAPPAMEDAPAFFFGISERKEFHGTEILRAASEASSCPTGDVTDHPNYIQFETAGQFPNNDELLVWLYHQVFRKLQRRALHADLRRVASLLLGRSVSAKAIARIQSLFDELVKCEAQTVASLKANAAGRATHTRICAWTDRFQISLLRELALGEAFLRRSGPGVDYCRLRQTQWYYPASERPDWTAWAAVVELAVRRLIAAARGASDSWAEDDKRVTVAPLPFPAVFFSRSPRCPDLLGILVAGFTRLTQPQVRSFAVRRSNFWHLSPASMPWPTGEDMRAPSAAKIWAWATEEIEEDDASRWLLFNGEPA